MESKSNADSLKKMRWLLYGLGLTKIPMIGYVRPKILKLNDDEVEVKIKLRRRTKNHLNSMYFGALAVGADIAAGIHVFYFSRNMGKNVSFAFKGIKGDFIKRAETDVIFKSDEGRLVKEAILKSISESERINQTINVHALDMNNELVAQFEMIVSVKVK